MKGVVMTFKKGATILVAFHIDGRTAIATCILTGKFAVLNGKETSQLENVNSGNPYYFSEDEIRECAPLNDPSLMGEVEELTI